jgi:hypothetical protein
MGSTSIPRRVRQRKRQKRANEVSKRARGKPEDSPRPSPPPTPARSRARRPERCLEKRKGGLRGTQLGVPKPFERPAARWAEAAGPRQPTDTSSSNVSRGHAGRCGARRPGTVPSRPAGGCAHRVPLSHERCVTRPEPRTRAASPALALLVLVSRPEALPRRVLAVASPVPLPCPQRLLLATTVLRSIAAISTLRQRPRHRALAKQTHRAAMHECCDPAIATTVPRAPSQFAPDPRKNARTLRAILTSGVNAYEPRKVRRAPGAAEALSKRLRRSVAKSRERHARRCGRSRRGVTEAMGQSSEVQ